MTSYKGVILVGGPSVGTRFRPLSMDLPKPLFPIAGYPIIFHHVSALARITGMSQVLLIGFYEQTVFESFIKDMQMEFPFIKFKYLREYQAMGTAGGLNHFRDEILSGNPDAFFVLNGDVASSFPLLKLLETHKKVDAIGTLLSTRMSKNNLSKYGCLVVEDTTNQVQHFVEKPESFISDIISCGVYLFNKEIFGKITTVAELRRKTNVAAGIDISQFKEKERLAASNAAFHRVEGRVQLETDLLPYLASDKTLYAYVMGSADFWLPIKTGSSTIAANRLYLQHFLHHHPTRLSIASLPIAITPSFYPPRKISINETFAASPAANSNPEIVAPVYIHSSAVIHPSAKIGPNAFIGPRVLIGRGVRVKDSLILAGVEINNESFVSNAVIGWESKIGSWSRVEGSGEYQDDEEVAATQKGLKIPTASILGKGVTVGDEIIIRDCIVLPYKELKQSFQREILI